MTDDFARSVQILVQIAGNPEQRLDAINKLTDQINGKKITLNDSISQLVGNANNATSALSKVSSTTQDISRAATDLGSKGVSAFDRIKASVSDLNVGVQTLAASLAGIAAGGAISGLAWKQSADFALLDEQIDRAIDNNKKLGISSQELTEFAKGEASKGEGTFQENKHELYNMLMAGSKYFKGSSQEKLSQADAIGDFYFSNQEMLKGQGIDSAEQLIQTAIRTTGKMSEKQANLFGPAIGLAPDAKEMGSAKSRLKYLEEAGAKVDMGAALDKRPWEAFLINVNSLKYAIGDGLAPVMSNFIKILSFGVNLLNKIPGAPALIGLIAGFIALASAATLVNGVVMPGIAILRSFAAAMTLSNLAATQNLIISKALIVTDWLGITSKVARTTATVAAATATAGLTGAIGMEIVALEVDTVATTAAATATTGLAAAEWAALSPLLLIAIPLVALAGLLYLVETRTHVFSNALKQLSETQLSKDIAKWFQDVGYWAGYAIDRFGLVIGSDLTNSIKTLDTAYSSIKSITSGDLLKSPIDLILDTKTESVSKSSSESVLGPMALIIRAGFPAIQKYLEIISNNMSFVKNLLDIGWNFVEGIYSGIVNFPKNTFKFVVDGLIGIGKWIYNGIIYWATWIYNGIIYWGGEAQKAIGSAFEALGISDQIDKFKAFVDDIKLSIGDLASDFKTYVGGLGDKFTTFVSDIINKFTTFVTDTKASISNLIPGWMKGGSDTGNAAAPTFEGFKEFIATETKGTDGYKKYAPMSDEVIQAAYTEAQTGIPQPHPYTDEYEYKLIVSGYEDYEKTLEINNNITNNNTTNSNIMNDFGAATEKVQQDDIAKIKESAESGKPISSLTPDSGNPSGLAKIAYNAADSASGGRLSAAVDTGKEAAGAAWNSLKDTVGFADGGLVQKTGFALVHEGEPIIPAEVANSSKLQSILENIAFGGETSTSTVNNNQPIINIHYHADPARGLLLDQPDFEHKVSDIIAKKLRQLNGY